MPATGTLASLQVTTSEQCVSPMSAQSHCVGLLAMSAFRSSGKYWVKLLLRQVLNIHRSLKKRKSTLWKDIPIPVPRNRLYKALDGTQRISAPISKDSPPFFNMFPTIVTVRCSPFILARLRVIFNGWVVTSFAGPWTWMNLVKALKRQIDRQTYHILLRCSPYHTGCCHVERCHWSAFVRTTGAGLVGMVPRRYLRIVEHCLV